MKKAEKEDLLSILKTMETIRAFEEKASELYAQGHIPGFLHLGIGQEGVAAGVCSALAGDDYVFGGHRSHPHEIAKGADLGKLLAELAGRSTGYCCGKGGSMHVVAMAVGFVVATGIVGGSIPLALGAALVCRERRKGQVSVVFFGDGAGQTGAFHESLNIASLWRLPVIFICENNGYAEFTPLSAHTPVAHLGEHAQTYHIPNVTLDGNDVLAVRKAVTEAVGRARSGEGPSFVECLTYRLRGHYEGDPAKYRELSEVADWKAKDPIRRFTTFLLEGKISSAEEMSNVRRHAQETVERAAEFALASPWPTADDLTRHVFAGE